MKIIMEFDDRDTPDGDNDIMNNKHLMYMASPKMAFALSSINLRLREWRKGHKNAEQIIKEIEALCDDTGIEEFYY